MAKICNTVVCENSVFSLTSDNELICKRENCEQQIVAHCRDFDAIADELGCIHIVASLIDGGIEYIKNVSERWGRGVISESIQADNIFIFSAPDGILIRYCEKGKLYGQKIDSEIHKAELLGRCSEKVDVFLTMDYSVYVNDKNMLCVNDDEVCYGGDISRVFAALGILIVKDSSGLKIADIREPANRTNLTKRYGRYALCPVIKKSGEELTLHWLDGKKLFSTRKTKTGWQRLKVEDVSEFEDIGVYKFCTGEKSEYTIGYKNNGIVCEWKEDIIEKKSFAEFEKNTEDKNLKMKPEADLLIEYIFDEIGKIHKKLNELHGVIEKIQKEKLYRIVLKAPKTARNKNLLKVHKK